MSPDLLGQVVEIVLRTASCSTASLGLLKVHGVGDYRPIGGGSRREESFAAADYFAAVSLTLVRLTRLTPFCQKQKPGIRGWGRKIRCQVSGAWE